MATHCATCGCLPLLDQTFIVKSYSNQIARETCEVSGIERLGIYCLSAPSVSILTKELDYLQH